MKDDEVHPTLKAIGLYLNTLAHNGVPAKNRHIAAMFHQGGGDAVFSNEVYKARHNGVDNPNIAVLKELHEAGVEFRVCGQGLIGKKVDPSQLLPGVQADLWALVTMVNLQSRGTSGWADGLSGFGAFSVGAAPASVSAEVSRRNARLQFFEPVLHDDDLLSRRLLAGAHRSLEVEQESPIRRHVVRFTRSGRNLQDGGWLSRDEG